MELHGQLEGAHGGERFEVVEVEARGHSDVDGIASGAEREHGEVERERLLVGECQDVAVAPLERILPGNRRVRCWERRIG